MHAWEEREKAREPYDRRICLLTLSTGARACELTAMSTLRLFLTEVSKGSASFRLQNLRIATKKILHRESSGRR